MNSINFAFASSFSPSRLRGAFAARCGRQRQWPRLARQVRTVRATAAAMGDDDSYGQAEVDPLEAAHHAAMNSYWSGVGACDNDLLGYMINPFFMGAPSWPNMRQAFRVVRTDSTLIIASDGLSDPFPEDALSFEDPEEGDAVKKDLDEDERLGFGIEVFIEVRRLQDLNFHEIKEHWAFAAIECFARNIAQMGGIAPQLDANGVMSIGLPIEEGPTGWVKENGMLGALIDAPQGNQRVNTVDTPIQPTRIVPITVVTAAEIDSCANNAADRELIARELGGHVTDPARASIR